MQLWVARREDNELADEQFGARDLVDPAQPAHPLVERLIQALEECVHRGTPEFLFGVEVVVHERLGDLGTRSDVTSRRTVERTFGEQLGRSKHDPIPRGLDTTISAIGNAVWLFATHPLQWARLRKSPDRIKAAFNEVLRLESPISCFTRVARVGTQVGGYDVPADSRVLVSFASANRDEGHWHEPNRFDILRESAGQLAFGYGEHACVWMGLARLEGAFVLAARVDRIELNGSPLRKPNNLIRSFSSLPVTVTRSEAA